MIIAELRKPAISPCFLIRCFYTCLVGKEIEFLINNIVSHKQHCIKIGKQDSQDPKTLLFHGRLSRVIPGSKPKGYP